MNREIALKLHHPKADILFQIIKTELLFAIYAKEYAKDQIA